MDDASITDPGYWVRHLREPVRFADAAATLIDAGHKVFLEAGPGTALTNLLLRQGRSDMRVPAYAADARTRGARIG